MKHENSSLDFIKGFIIGGAIGAIAALLMAPRPGEETRTQIRTKGTELKEKAETTVAEMQKRVDASAADLRARFDELSAKVDEAITQNRSMLAQRTADIAKEIAPE